MHLLTSFRVLYNATFVSDINFVALVSNKQSLINAIAIHNNRLLTVFSCTSVLLNKVHRANKSAYETILLWSLEIAHQHLDSLNSNTYYLKLFRITISRGNARNTISISRWSVPTFIQCAVDPIKMV